MSSVVRQESLVDRVGLWAGGWALSASVWGPVQVVVHPDRVLGDGGLGGIGLLAMLAGWVFFVVIGVAAFREAMRERSQGVGGSATARMLGLGVVAWIAEREALVGGGHQVTTAVALVASLLMPFVFIASLWIVTGGRQRRRGCGSWLLCWSAGCLETRLTAVALRRQRPRWLPRDGSP